MRIVDAVQFQSGGQLGRVLERDHAVEVVIEVFAQFGDPVAQHVQLHLYSLRFGQKAPIPRFSHDTYAPDLEKLQYRGDELPDSPISESSTFHRLLDNPVLLCPGLFGYTRSRSEGPAYIPSRAPGAVGASSAALKGS